jgi:hypothetical protein
MKSKDKASDLVCYFYEIQSNEYDYGINWEMAKQCAIIAVNEILMLDIETNILDYWWWQEVKIEIEKL